MQTPSRLLLLLVFWSHLYYFYISTPPPSPAHLTRFGAKKVSAVNELFDAPIYCAHPRKTIPAELRVPDIWRWWDLGVTMDYRGFGNIGPWRAHLSIANVLRMCDPGLSPKKNSGARAAPGYSDLSGPATLVTSREMTTRARRRVCKPQEIAARETYCAPSVITIAVSLAPVCDPCQTRQAVGENRTRSPSIRYGSNWTYIYWGLMARTPRLKELLCLYSSAVRGWCKSIHQPSVSTRDRARRMYREIRTGRRSIAPLRF